MQLRVLQADDARLRIYNDRQKKDEDGENSYLQIYEWRHHANIARAACTFLNLPSEIFMLTLLVQLGYEPRMEKTLYLLKYCVNEAKDNIPDVVREYFKCIKQNLVCKRKLFGSLLFLYAHRQITFR